MNSTVRTIPVLQAKDLARARRYYEEKLGFSVEQDDPDTLLLRSGDSFIHLYETSLPTPESTVMSLDVEDFGSAIEELRRQGVRLEDYDLPDLKTENGVAVIDGMHTAWFKDSEGNILNVASWREAESARRGAA